MYSSIPQNSDRHPAKFEPNPEWLNFGYQKRTGQATKHRQNVKILMMFTSGYLLSRHMVDT